MHAMTLTQCHAMVPAVFAHDHVSLDDINNEVASPHDHACIKTAKTSAAIHTLDLQVCYFECWPVLDETTGSMKRVCSGWLFCTIAACTYVRSLHALQLSNIDECLCRPCFKLTSQTCWTANATHPCNIANAHMLELTMA